MLSRSFSPRSGRDSSTDVPASVRSVRNPLLSQGGHSPGTSGSQQPLDDRGRGAVGASPSSQSYSDASNFDSKLAPSETPVPFLEATDQMLEVGVGRSIQGGAALAVFEHSSSTDILEATTMETPATKRYPASEEINRALELMRATSTSEGGRLLASHASFFRSAPWLLASALEAVGQPTLPDKWGQILMVLEANGQTTDQLIM